MDWVKLAGLLVTLLGVAGTGVWGYAKLTGKVSAHGSDIKKNDERIRKELNDDAIRNEKRFKRVEDDVYKLIENRSVQDKRLTMIEEQTKHTSKTVDVTASDVKDIMKQLTQVATVIATKNDQSR